MCFLLFPFHPPLSLPLFQCIFFRFETVGLYVRFIQLDWYAINVFSEWVKLSDSIAIHNLKHGKFMLFSTSHNWLTLLRNIDHYLLNFVGKKHVLRCFFLGLIVLYLVCIHWSLEGIWDWSCRFQSVHISYRTILFFFCSLSFWFYSIMCLLNINICVISICSI